MTCHEDTEAVFASTFDRVLVRRETPPLRPVVITGPRTSSGCDG